MNKTAKCPRCGLMGELKPKPEDPTKVVLNCGNCGARTLETDADPSSVNRFEKSKDKEK